MAGLYEFWRDRTLPADHPRAWWATCTILTTDAEATPFAGARGDGPRSLADIHPRMPLALPRDRWSDWLDPSRADPEDVRALLAPPPAGTMRAYPVPAEVSNVRNNGADLVRELESPGESTLF
jgi:putative SOS response-associated peptidase YedK